MTSRSRPRLTPTRYAMLMAAGIIATACALGVVWAVTP